MHDTITGPVFQEMLIFGATSIAKEKQSINDLNVFPVPDGDTGTNMSLTMHAAAQELQKRSPATVDLASSITASALLRGARGNSGVILSLLFRGMSKSLKGCVTADGCTFAAAMQEGVSAAYNAVMKPAEGTILTVSRLAADRAMAASAEKNSVEYVIEQAISQGEETLRQTVDMNPVLKKAGVVDAGGKGFLVILKGMLAALRGETMPTLETEHAARDKADFASVGDEDITFAFDTVFIVRRIDDRSIEPFREFLNGIGDSLDGLVLTNNPLVELVLNMQELLTLTLHHAGYRYASPPAHHFGNIVGGHLLTNHCLTTLRSLELQLNIGNVIIEFLQLAIAYLSHTAVISLTLSFLGFEFEILDLLLVLLNLIHKTFLSLPFCTERVFFLFVLSNLFVELFDLILVALALDSLALNLNLFQMTRDLVQFLRH